MRISVLVSVLLLASASAASSAELLSNGSFELPALGGTAYDYPGNPDLVTANPNNYPATVNDWTYGGSAIVNTSVGANAWYGGAAPAGYDAIQFAALQAGSSLSQIFNSGAAGLGNLSWLSGGRPDLNSVGGNQSYNVFLNGNLLGTYFTTDGQAFTLESFANASLLAGSNTLNFVGLSTADETAFIDKVSVDLKTVRITVPEPMTLGLFAAGLAGIAARRRRKAPKA